MAQLFIDRPSGQTVNIALDRRCKMDVIGRGAAANEAAAAVPRLSERA